jgi:RHS repeat-associated protein
LIDWRFHIKSEVQFVYDGDGNRLLKIEGQAGLEITTYYAGQLFEKQFNTTASRLGESVPGGSGSNAYVVCKGNRNGVTDFGYTGQRHETGFGLMDYNARYYSPRLGRFVSPDSIVPDPTTAKGFNRYMYADGNPLRYVDPSGHAPQFPGDPDPDNASCRTDWCWDNRWHSARGALWNQASERWVVSGADAIFYDQDILRETMGEAGIRFVNGTFVNNWYVPGVWSRREQELMGQGIVALGNKVGGLGQLHQLLGNRTTALARVALNGGDHVSAFVGLGRVQVQGVLQNQVTVLNNMFHGGEAVARGLIVHELAHVMDFNASTGYQALSANVPGGHDGFIGNYGSPGGPLEYFAEAVAMWVYDSNDEGSYRNMRRSVDNMPPAIDQYLQINLAAAP